MKSSTRLESAVFQLTPTRTRFDLVIVANGKTEKIASGLINPFLAHLKSARDQFAKGGYTIVLKPESATERWFTKDTVERFVRFVNTPVVLERVHILESEIIQIEKAITIQNQNDIELSKVENVHSKPAESTQGFMDEEKVMRLLPNVNEEKAIVLYEPSALADDETKAYLSEENSKVQLLKVLETRKSFLLKEQKMAFARALASGFEIDHMSPLISFAECFTASRFMDACTRFVKIWKATNDIGQWLETERADATSSQCDYATMATAGNMLSGVPGKEMILVEPLPESAVEPGPNNNSSHQSPVGSKNHVHGELSQPIYPPWGMVSPPGLPIFQGYPVQGMPYYPSYPGHGPFMYPPYQSPNDVESSSHEKRIQKRQSFETNGKSESQEVADAEGTSRYDSDMENEASDDRGVHKKTRSSKKKSGTVVIRNINYITARRQNDSESVSPSNTDDESDKDVGDTSVKRTTTRKKSYTEYGDLDYSDEQLQGKASSGDHWHAFQNCLMKSAEKSDDTCNALFSMEKGAKNPRLIVLDKDPLADTALYQSAHGASVYLNPSGDTHRMQKTSHEELLKTNFGNQGDRVYEDSSFDIQVAERDGSVIRHCTANDNFMVQRLLIQPNDSLSSADMCANVYTNGTHKVSDDSFILPSRSRALHEGGTVTIDGIDMNYELPSSHPNTDNSRIKSQETYEPEDLGWIAERGTLRDSAGYNPVVDYEMEANINKTALQNSKKVTGSNKKDNNQKPKVASATLDGKKSLGLIKRGKPSKMSPIEEARARAEKLRSFKVDLQKQKREKEEEQKKRIEALKIERQKRISTRSNVTSAKFVLPSPQTRKQLLTKASPGSLNCKESKFSDSEPGFSSPLQGVSRRTLSLGAIESRKAPKPKSNIATPSSVNKVDRLVSSLSEQKTDQGFITPEPKASMSRIRRLSEPRKGTNLISPARRLNGSSVAKANTSSGSEIKKVSASVSLGKTKAATLPDQKVKIPDSDAHCDSMYLEKSIIKQMTGSENQSSPAHTSGDANVENSKVVFQQSAVDAASDVENIKVVVQQSAVDATSGIQNSIANLEYEKHLVTDEPKVRVLSGIDQHSEQVKAAMTNVDGEPRANQSTVQFDAHEVMKSRAEKDSSKSSAGETPKPYQAPYARVSSFEEPCTGNSEYEKATIISPEKETSVCVAATQASSSQPKYVSVPESSEKLWVKEPSKGGFKRLLKFGKKSISSSGDHNSEIDSLSRASSEKQQCATNGTSPGQAPTLKNLISHDETELASTPPPKSSRHFSLLSPFRKSSEKKIIVL